ncbi:hypothetical protein CROQUDRAFT_661291 [Cronartium quercuum f. sp. fusiforme G11]|uniref:Enoyl-CoA hydratase n=1 Tax=Cronartium quercuum f. sp. fusiforme G11 TaxID=708437 RepID=A0A9P6T9A5_9BASI|nr:hypothetical protein CROQUDRAFT_661291 [Cronartium quercuum f. sp. fusiforme G11]
MEKLTKIDPKMSPIQPLSSPTFYPFATLTKPIDYPGVFLLELHASPDNRLTQTFIQSTLIPALSDVEREFRASRANKLGPAEDTTTGWKTPKQPGQYALVTCGNLVNNKFYSNGLDLKQAFADDGFFQHVLNRMYSKILSFPMPTIAALNGHAFAGGFSLALSHDFRIMKDNEQKGTALMCMNEIEFGATVPRGLLALLEAKFPNKNEIQRCLIDAHRYGVKEAFKLGIVDQICPESQLINQALKFASEKSIRATTGVYDLMKEEIYRDTLEILSLTDEGYQDYNSTNLRRLHRLGRDHLGSKAKL